MKKKTNLASKTSNHRAKNSGTKRNPFPRVAMRNRKTMPKVPESPESQLEEQFQRFFTAFPLPSHGLYTEADSLEQPSAQKYIPSITIPTLVS